ncbi:hypothetical protein CF122_06260 [Aeromonas media]|nr:hypothetical protein CF122_06260 [Aeromonas media]
MLLGTPYPINAFPETIRNAIYEMHNSIKAPIAMLGGTTLTAISLAMQNSINVCRMEGLIGPVSLAILTEADSGERKSSCMQAVNKPFFLLENELFEKYQDEMIAYNVAMEIFNENKRSILKMVRQGGDAVDANERLTALMKTYPIKPTRIRFIFNDATPAAIKDYLCGDWRAIGLISDEAGIILNGPAFNQLSFVNKLWDGTTISVDRKNSSEFLINNPRLTISLLVQPKTFNDFLKRKGELAKDIGVFARFFVCSPQSTQGKRQISSPVISTEHLPIFHRRLMELARESINVRGEDDRICLRFSPEAQERWITFYNQAEDQIGVFGHLHDVKDYISKLSDNLARLAALLHHFNGGGGDIPLSILENAISITCWYGDEYRRMFGKNQGISQSEIDANELHSWIIEYCKSKNVPCIRKQTLFHYGPNRLREAEKLNEVLNLLLSQGRILVGKVGKRYIIQPIENFNF